MGGARPAFKLKSAADNAGARAQACQCLDDQREATRELVARTAIEPHPLTILASNDAEAVMLDLVQPLAAGGPLDRRRAWRAAYRRTLGEGADLIVRCAHRRAVAAARHVQGLFV